MCREGWCVGVPSGGDACTKMFTTTWTMKQISGDGKCCCACVGVWCSWVVEQATSQSARVLSAHKGIVAAEVEEAERTRAAYLSDRRDLNKVKNAMMGLRIIFTTFTFWCVAEHYIVAGGAFGYFWARNFLVRPFSFFRRMLS